MSKLNLVKYMKPYGDKAVEMKTTSINLESHQYDFIRAKRLNLSQLIRDLIQGLINEETKQNKGDK